MITTLLQYWDHAQFATSCQRGVILISDGSSSIKTGQIYHPINNDYKEGHFIGSFCPTQNDTSGLKLYAFPKIDVSMTGSPYYSNSGGAIRCSGSDVGTIAERSYPSNRCWSFHIHLYSSCSYSAYMYIDRKSVGSSAYMRATHGYFYTCTYDDCLPGYYGSNCQYGPVAYYSGTNCTVSLGMSGDGKCTCSAATVIQSYCRPGTVGQGFEWSRYKYKTDSTPYKTQIISNLNQLSLSEDEEIYTYNVFKGYVFPVTSGTYTFRVKSNSKVKLTVGSSDSSYPVSDFFICTTENFVTTVITSLTANNLYSISILYVSGCFAVDRYLELQWMRPGTGVYENIPELYVYH
jgi:hypothetical protein